MLNIAVLLIDKPANCSSNQLLQKIKRTLNVKKAGHTGTLDPFATGLMIFCFNQATKCIEYILNADKQYEFTLKLGEKTDTADRTGNIINQQPIPELLNTTYIQSKCNEMIGEIQQTPPMYCALKHQGKPLYKLARKNITVERQPRPITIYNLRCLSIKNNMIQLCVHGSKGLYVRALGESLAELLGSCGHIHTLRRTTIAKLLVQSAYNINNQLSIDQQQQNLLQHLQPVDALLPHIPSIQLNQPIAHALSLGQKPTITLPNNNPQLIKYYYHSKLMGLAEYSNHQLKAKKNICI